MNKYGINYEPQEKVYDRCAYKGCRNGKYTGYHLFRFPAAKDPRQVIWIENSTEHDDRLRSWSASTLRRAGICRMHFSRDSFVIGNDKKLTSKAVPLPWTEQTNLVTDPDSTTEDILKSSDMKQEVMEFVDADPSCSKEDCRDRRTEKLEVNPAQEDVFAMKTYRAVKLEFSAKDDDDPEWMVHSPGKSDSLEVSAGKNRTAQDTLMKAHNRIVQLEKAQRSLKRQNDLLRRQVRRFRDRFKRMERPVKARHES